MICFPCAKINLGLHVIRKRKDGFHDLNTVFYPIGWKDALEVLIQKHDAPPFSIQVFGNRLEGPQEDNIIHKAWKLLSGERRLPAVKVLLYKNIPAGAGLGGGSSDAATFLSMMNELITPAISKERLLELAAETGSDSPFFLHPQPTYAEGRGDQFSPVPLDLSAYHICVVFPGIVSSTKEAFAHITPKVPKTNLAHLIRTFPVENWRDLIQNDFEDFLFSSFHELEVIKDSLYRSGALFAGLSGSGSSLYGIFKDKPQVHFPPQYRVYFQEPVKANSLV